MGGVYIDGMSKLSTLDVKHVKVIFEGEVWLIGRLPEGDYAFHHQYRTYRDGYGGDTIEFLMEDGTIESFKGPFSEDPSDRVINAFEWQTSLKGLRNSATRIVVGLNIQGYLT